MATSVPITDPGPATKAKKPLWKNMGFQIIVAMVLGAAIGVLFPDVAVQLRILGDIFLRLIKTAVAPLVFLCVAIGVVSAGDIKRVGKVGLVAMLYFEFVLPSPWRSACWRPICSESAMA
jgi:aerobic C4-dicarboxylate transport protein